jgi:hypothetical protein
MDFDKGRLCEAGEVAAAVTDWLRSHVMLETRPNTALTME